MSTSLRGLTAAVLIFVTFNLVIPTYHELAKPFPRGHAGHAGSFFKRSVVYICEHTATDGAMGITLTRPSEMTLEEMLAQIEITPEPRDPAIRLNRPVLAGGPIANDRGFVLHTPSDQFGASLQLTSDVMITTSRDILETLGTPNQPKQVLVALGYAGWEKISWKKRSRPTRG